MRLKVNFVRTLTLIEIQSIGNKGLFVDYSKAF